MMAKASSSVASMSELLKTMAQQPDGYTEIPYVPESAQNYGFAESKDADEPVVKKDEDEEQPDYSM